MSELKKMQRVYLSGLFQILVDRFLENVQLVYTTSNAASLTLLILGIVLVILFFLVTWVPALSDITKEVRRVRSMILMIPLDICAELSTIRAFLQEYL